MAESGMKGRRSSISISNMSFTFHPRFVVSLVGFIELLQQTRCSNVNAFWLLTRLLRADAKWRGSHQRVSFYGDWFWAFLQQLQKAWPEPHLHVRSLRLMKPSRLWKRKTVEELHRETIRPSVSSTAFNHFNYNGANNQHDTLLLNLTPWVSVRLLHWSVCCYLCYKKISNCPNKS